MTTLSPVPLPTILRVSVAHMKRGLVILNQLHVHFESTIDLTSLEGMQTFFWVGEKLIIFQ